MSYSLKITKSKIKLFLFFILIDFVLSFLFVFLIGIITKIGGLEMREKMGIISHFLEALRLLIVSYLVLIFLKKEFFLKKYFKEFIEIFFALFVLDKLFALIFSLIPLNIGSSIFVQATYLVLHIIMYCAVICFIAEENCQSSHDQNKIL